MILTHTDTHDSIPKQLGLWGVSMLPRLLNSVTETVICKRQQFLCLLSVLVDSQLRVDLQ
jgi:hypothetical protein